MPQQVWRVSTQCADVFRSLILLSVLGYCFREAALRTGYAGHEAWRPQALHGRVFGSDFAGGFSRKQTVRPPNILKAPELPNKYIYPPKTSFWMGKA